MSNPITDAVADANDEAVTMLRNGDNDHARASFQRALEVIQQYLGMSSFPGELPDITCRYSPTQHLRVEQGVSDDEKSRETNKIIVSVALGDNGLAESQSAAPEELFSFYNHAFVVGFRPNMATESSQQETYFGMLTSVLVFNIALTHHRKGLVDEHNSSQHLRKSIRFYQLATTTSLLINQGGSQELHVLELVSWNNIGHIVSRLTEHENAMKCRVHLYKALFADPGTTLHLTYGYSYSLFYLFVVSSEVRRREMGLSLERLEIEQDVMLRLE